MVKSAVAKASADEEGGDTMGLIQEGVLRPNSQPKLERRGGNEFDVTRARAAVLSLMEQIVNYENPDALRGMRSPGNTLELATAIENVHKKGAPSNPVEAERNQYAQKVFSLGAEGFGVKIELPTNGAVFLTDASDLSGAVHHNAALNQQR